jgi:predicted RNase H-like HicB family nuclease
MKIDLNKGVSFQIEGELGKFHTLPVEALVKIAENLQDLLLTIAKSDVDSNDPIHLENFKVELSGFMHGSAVPQFVFTPRIQTSIGNITKQRKVVNQKFVRLMGLSNNAEYMKINDMYPDALRRNQIVDKLYDFTNSFGNAPTSIVDIGKNQELKSIYKIKRLKPEVKKLLTTVIVELNEQVTEEFGVAKIKLTTNKKGATKKKIEQLYRKSDTTLSYSPDVIVYNDKAYVLNFPLRSSLDKENDYYVIHNEMLDIIGTGETEDDAEKNFAEEFDFIYKRYNELNDNQLSDKLNRIKVFLNHLVKSVE